MSRDPHDPIGLMNTETGVEGSGENLYGPILGTGAVIGSYVVERLRSRGGFGSVYRVRHAEKGTPAAIKVLHQHMLGSESLLRRFQREAEAVGRIHHPNVVELYEFGSLEDGRPYLAMEWLEGRTLEDELIRSGALSGAAALAILEPLCAGLSAAHSAGIIHRDLKASNVMLADTHDGRVLKVVDFGIAKLVEDVDGQRLTTTGIRIGTPAYMAPEQILGKPVGPATDIYAIGVLLFHMLTGRLPFGGKTAIEVEDQHLHAQPPRPSDLARIPTPLDEVILRCLEKEPPQRFPTVDDLLAAARAAQAGEDRPSRRFRTGAGSAFGLHVRSDDLDLMDRARASCEASSFQLVVDTDAELLAVAAPPGEAASARAMTRALRALAESLASDGASVTVHAGSVQTLIVDGCLQFVGGELLDAATWTSSASGLTITEAAKAALGS